MKIRRTINVSKIDIAHGQRFASGACPVARAMERALGQAVSVVGDYMGWRLQGGGSYRRLPPKVNKFIQDFDRYKPVKPFGFTLIYSA